MDDQKRFVLDFIKKHELCVLSTVTPEGLPEAGAIEFAETEDLELIFDTFKTYRKYKNLQNNPNVAVVIGWDENITVQYEGKATELTGEDLRKYQSLYFKKNPDAQKWLKFPEITYFKITPTWLRYRDGNTDPMTIFEINNFSKE